MTKELIWQQRTITIKWGTDKHLSVDVPVYGQLAITPTRPTLGFYAPWSITHVASGLAVADNQPNIEMVVKLVEHLSGLDFDRYFEQAQRGVTDTDFVDRAKVIIETWKGV